MTPLQSGAAPMMVYTMKRAGVPVPVALTVTLMASSRRCLFRAGGSARDRLRRRQVAGRSTAMAGPLPLRPLHREPERVLRARGAAGRGDRLSRMVWHLVHRITPAPRQPEPPDRGSARGAASGASTRPTDVLAVQLAQGLAVAPRGHDPLRALSRQQAAGRVRGAAGDRYPGAFRRRAAAADLITFMLYFAPTPGASGIAEMLSAAVMSSVRAPGADPALHADLAPGDQLLHDGLRLLRLLRLGPWPLQDPARDR